MPQPIEKLNRVLKAMSSGKRPALRPKTIEKKEEDVEQKWKLAWMNVYDECRMELAKLRSENVDLNESLDAERAKVSEKTEKNRLLADKIRAEWERNDKKTEKIDRLKQQLADLQSKTKTDASTQTEDAEAATKVKSEPV